MHKFILFKTNFVIVNTQPADEEKRKEKQRMLLSKLKKNEKLFYYEKGIEILRLDFLLYIDMFFEYIN